MNSEGSVVEATPQDDALVGAARILAHVKENNVTWMVALLVSYQMGLLEHFWAYGSGMC